MYFYNVFFIAFPFPRSKIYLYLYSPSDFSPRRGRGRGGVQGSSKSGRAEEVGTPNLRPPPPPHPNTTTPTPSPSAAGEQWEESAHPGRQFPVYFFMRTVSWEASPTFLLSSHCFPVFAILIPYQSLYYYKYPLSQNSAAVNLKKGEDENFASFYFVSRF